VSDKETTRVYDAQAQEYAALVNDDDPSGPALADFIRACGPGGKALDLGCGPGHAAARMADAGLKVVATDASVEMIALAARHPGVEARQASFDDLSEIETYDGIWASFSLLHASRAHFPIHLAQIRRALKPGGIFHIGMKTGTGEARDKLGRFYTYYETDELAGYLSAAGLFETDRVFGETMGLDGEPAAWVRMTARA
jgi:SAM-dependent methyltransferase